MGKDLNKPVKKDDPSLKLDGASPGRLAPKVPKYKQLGLFGDQAKRIGKKKKATNNVNIV